MSPTIRVVVRRPCLPVGDERAVAGSLYEYVVGVGRQFDHLAPEFYVNDQGELYIKNTSVRICPPFVIEIHANLPVPE